MEKEMKDALQALDKFSTSFQSVQEAVRPLIVTLKTIRSLPSDEEVNDKMDALSRARLHITLCYTINSLFSMYLRTQGVDPTGHPVSDELVRVQDAFLRLRKVEAGNPAHSKLNHYEQKVQERKRNVRDAMAQLKVEQIKLSSSVFPQEMQLYNALTKQSTVSKKFDNENDDDDGSDDNDSEDKSEEAEDEVTDNTDDSDEGLNGKIDNNIVDEEDVHEKIVVAAKENQSVTADESEKNKEKKRKKSKDKQKKNSDSPSSPQKDEIKEVMQTPKSSEKKKSKTAKTPESVKTKKKRRADRENSNDKRATTSERKKKKRKRSSSSS